MAAKLDCTAAQKLIQPYLDEEIGGRQCNEFLNHIRECENCRHELETSYIVEYALKYLDDDKLDNFDINGFLEEQINLSERRISRRQLLNVLIWIAIVVMALVIAGIIFRLAFPELFTKVLSDLMSLFGIPAV